MDDTAIKVENVSKVFKLPHEKHSSIKSTVVNFYRRKKTYEMQQALKDVSFEVKKGEFFGIIGRNGSGKSTMLKTLAGIYAPTKGAVEVNGKLTPFIELGVGFNPELSGHDNVFLNGALLGFNRKEMQAMYKDIVEFAELEKFMDQKLKNYSSGMQVRLAFSIAIRAKSDILLIDEVLAVGDENFQRKCLDIFEQYKATNQTVILVTHDMDTVRKYCNRAMLLNAGKVVDIGNPRTIAGKYSQFNQKNFDKELTHENRKLSQENSTRVRLLDIERKPKHGFSFGNSMIVEINWNRLKVKDFESIGIHILKLSGEHLTGINSRNSSHAKGWKNKGQIEIEFPLNIMPGKYYVLVEVFEEEGRIIDSVSKGLQFTVSSTKMKWSGLVELDHKWHERIV